MRCIDLFAGGCNGFGLAAEWMGWQTVACVEIDGFCRKLLKQNFPESEIYGDIREFNRINADKYTGRIDLITGGFPCQPFSTAGKRGGTDDDRYLWPEMLETIRIIQPSFVIGENVAGLTSMEDGRTFEKILSSLEDEGYTVESFILPACSVGAWHRRDRVWIIAYLPNPRIKSLRRQKVKTHDIKRNEINANSESNGIQRQRTSGQQKPQTQDREVLSGCHPERDGQSYWQAEPDLDRMVHGIPNRTHRIKALGNAIVPQVAYELYKAIEETFGK